MFIGSLQAAGLGIDLTAASVVIHYDRWWNAARENQATNRVHRIGQTKGVNKSSASTNLVSWEPILTNPPVAGAFEFTDLAYTNYARRYYRAAEVVPPAPLQFDTSAGALSMTNGEFQLRLEGLTGQGPVIIYASANLAIWEAIYTNAAATGTLEIRDTSAASVPWRYYRATEGR